MLLQECGSKVLKLEYPGSADGCRRVTDALDVPWAVLSAGVDHDAFCAQLRDAMDGGADGFIAGRSLWKEAVGTPPEAAPPLPRRDRPAAHGGDARDRRSGRLSLGSAAPGHRRRDHVLQGDGPRRRRPGARPGPRADAVDARADRRGDRSARARADGAVGGRARRSPPRRPAPWPAIGVAGMAETGVLLDAAGRPVGPGDRLARRARRGGGGRARGRARRARVRRAHRPAGLARCARWPSCAGSARISPARGAAVRWLGVPEWVARSLGAADVAELSLASRTGLLELRERRWWPDALAWLGVGADFMAEPVAARHAGRARRRRAAGGARRGDRDRRPRPRRRDGRRGRRRRGRRAALLRDVGGVRADDHRRASSRRGSPRRSPRA